MEVVYTGEFFFIIDPVCKFSFNIPGGTPMCVYHCRIACLMYV